MPVGGRRECSAGVARDGYAQEATIGGTVSDATDAVLPGETVTARHEATGNTFFSVTDNELNIRYGQKNESTNIAYSPRVIQLGFRMTL